MSVLARLASRHAVQRVPARISLFASFQVVRPSSAIYGIVGYSQNHQGSTENASNMIVGALLGIIPAMFLVKNEKHAFCSAENSPLDKGRVKITDVEAEMIAKRLQGMIDIPGIPNAIERPIVEQAIKAIIDVCPLVLPEQVFNKLIAGEAGINGVSEAIIRQINDEVYIPLLSREAQKFVVEQICIILFSPNTNFETVRRQMVARALKELFNADSRVCLATKLNETVDIPLISENNEQIMAEQLVNLCFDVLETFIPTCIRDILETTSPEELRDVRDNMVNRLSEKIDVPFTSEEHEQKALRFIVDFFLSIYGLQEGTKHLDEQLAEVEHKLKSVEIELKAFQEISKEKIKKMKETRGTLRKKKRELSRTSSWLGALKFW
jgi:hypothetical protein